MGFHPASIQQCFNEALDKAFTYELKEKNYIQQWFNETFGFKVFHPWTKLIRDNTLVEPHFWNPFTHRLNLQGSFKRALHRHSSVVISTINWQLTPIFNSVTGHWTDLSTTFIHIFLAILIFVVQFNKLRQEVQVLYISCL